MQTKNKQNPKLLRKKGDAAVDNSKWVFVLTPQFAVERNKPVQPDYFHERQLPTIRF
jgi:hypothetical protein